MSSRFFLLTGCCALVTVSVFCMTRPYRCRPAAKVRKEPIIAKELSWEESEKKCARERDHFLKSFA
jgi:hypothetical protein